MGCKGHSIHSMFITAIVNAQTSLFKVVVGFQDSRAPRRFHGSSPSPSPPLEPPKKNPKKHNPPNSQLLSATLGLVHFLITSPCAPHVDPPSVAPQPCQPPLRMAALVPAVPRPAERFGSPEPLALGAAVLPGLLGAAAEGRRSGAKGPKGPKAGAM